MSLSITCGRSSVVERNVANVDVVSSNLIARFGPIDLVGPFCIPPLLDRSFRRRL